MDRYDKLLVLLYFSYVSHKPTLPETNGKKSNWIIFLIFELKEKFIVTTG